MTLEVLQEKSQINLARQQLIDRNISHLDAPDSPWRSLLRRFGLVRNVVVGDFIKSWDVLATIMFLESHVNKNAPILDIGCYASEVVVALHKAGYSSLVGADLNPNLEKMPYNEHIRYEITNFMHTAFANGSFQAVTAISVIEHDFDGEALLKEMSRLLVHGGYFIASFDYWPEKIDTSGTRFFNMDWKIFSSEEVRNFVSDAAKYGLHPVGKMTYASSDRPIDCAGKQYTFGWLVLEKAG